MPRAVSSREMAVSRELFNDGYQSRRREMHPGQPGRAHRRELSTHAEAPVGRVPIAVDNATVAPEVSTRERASVMERYSCVALNRRVRSGKFESLLK
jgi:hypothetical protein